MDTGDDRCRMLNRREERREEEGTEGRQDRREIKQEGGLAGCIQDKVYAGQDS